MLTQAGHDCSDASGKRQWKRNGHKLCGCPHIDLALLTSVIRKNLDANFVL